MNRYWFILFFLLLRFSSLAQQSNLIPAIVPLPVEINKIAASNFIIQPTTIIYCDDTLLQQADLINTYLNRYTSFQLKKTTTDYFKNNRIILKIDALKVLNKEGYILRINNNIIELFGHDVSGVMHGIATLRQIWQVKNNKLIVPAYLINDYPRFAYRGMHLDVSRHFFPVSFIKKYIDLLALYKFNTFHWHLTDDQGWRIEIKKYPRLQTVAAWRNETLIGHKKELPHVFDGKKHGGYYTQNEVRDIVKYATARSITIIPEIEMPGHASAALAAYPNLGCTGGPYKTATSWGVFDDVFCAGNNETFVFITNVLDEVMQLFPSNKIHIGGDECPKTKWMACPKCQKRIKTEGLKDAHELQSYFIQRIEKYVNSKGHSIIGWDEILEGGLAPNATVMSWRGEEGGLAAATQKHDVIMTPESSLYFDYYQSLYSSEKLAAGGFTPLSKVYAYEPGGSVKNDSISKYIIGVQGGLWTEYMTDENHVEYMMFPRAAALAEVTWSPKKMHDYDNFSTRLRSQKKLFQKLKINAADNYDEINSTIDIQQGKVIVSLKSSLPNAKIQYNVKGDNNPIFNDYHLPIIITKSGWLKARMINNGMMIKRDFKQFIQLHKAIGAKVLLKNKPIERFNTDPQTLVNGLAGSNRYNDNQWLGFSGDDFEAVIDLKKTDTIQSIESHLLNYHLQKMWAPTSLQFSVSCDGLNFKQIYEQSEFPINGINWVKYHFDAMPARYIKVVGINKGIIPNGEYGAGGKCLLLVDELIIN